MEVSKEVHGAMQIKVNAKPAAVASGAPTEDITGVVGNVTDMLATCCPDTRCRSSSGQMGPCCRHKFKMLGPFVSATADTNFSLQNPSAYVETYVWYVSYIRTLKLETLVF
jgi:hypothetical protein